MTHKSINEIILETVGKGSFNEKGIYTISVSTLFYLHIISVTFCNHPHPILGAASTTCSTLIQIISVPGIFDLIEAILPQVSSLGYVPPPDPCLM